MAETNDKDRPPPPSNLLKTDNETPCICNFVYFVFQCLYSIYSIRRKIIHVLNIEVDYCFDIW